MKQLGIATGGWHGEIFCSLLFILSFLPSVLLSLFLRNGNHFAKVKAMLGACLWTLTTLNWTLINSVYAQYKTFGTLNISQRLQKPRDGKCQVTDKGVRGRQASNLLPRRHGALFSKFWEKRFMDMEFYTEPNYQLSMRKIQKFLDIKRCGDPKTDSLPNVSTSTSLQHIFCGKRDLRL